MSELESALVVKSNHLIQASYRLTLVEQQIILYAIVQGRETGVLLSAEHPISIEVLDFAKRFNLDRKSAYAQIQHAILTLFDRHLVIQDEGRKVVTRWLQDRAYDDREGRFHLTFARLVIPYITRLEKEFTSYRLSRVAGMSSVHAIRLYELLIQYAGLGRRDFGVDELKGILGLEKEYPMLADFKKRVVDVAVEQICRHSDIEVSYTQQKLGRQVTHFGFMITLRKEENKPASKKSLVHGKVNQAMIDKVAPGTTVSRGFGSGARNKTA